MKPLPRWRETYQKKVLDPTTIFDTVRALKEQGQTIVTVNGSFDLLHVGHLDILFEASQQGDCLIVALNSDDSIRKYKNEKRPIISLKHRLELLAAIEFVTYVTWFEETDPITILQKIQPHVHVNGLEYGENCIEAHTVRSNGGHLYLVDRQAGLSTTHIIQKIQAS